jgi:hypothetical protein
MLDRFTSIIPQQQVLSQRSTTPTCGCRGSSTPRHSYNAYNACSATRRRKVRDIMIQFSIYKLGGVFMLVVQLPALSWDISSGYRRRVFSMSSTGKTSDIISGIQNGQQIVVTFQGVVDPFDRLCRPVEVTMLISGDVRCMFSRWERKALD